ncbi:MAG: transposase [Chlorobi bacterium]|nr:transposase [Chlorobiota bacterium]
MSNEFEFSAKEVSDYYRKRWDIEVFSDLSNRNLTLPVWFHSIKMKFK